MRPKTLKPSNPKALNPEPDGKGPAKKKKNPNGPKFARKQHLAELEDQRQQLLKAKVLFVAFLSWALVLVLSLGFGLWSSTAVGCVCVCLFS